MYPEFFLMRSCLCEFHATVVTCEICTSLSVAVLIVVLTLSHSRSVLMASACGTPNVMRCKIVLIGVSRLLLYILINNKDG